jgi:hypothetical protein
VRYLSVPSAIREAAVRWTVLLGAIVPVDGVWRTGAGIVLLAPAEGDMSAEIAHKGLEVLSRHVATGHMAQPSDFPQFGRQAPFGVAATMGEPAEEDKAYLVGKFFGVLVPSVLVSVHIMRQKSRAVTNTDEEKLCAAEAYIRLDDGAETERRLLARPDVGIDESDEGLVWWGRPLTADELATIRGGTGADGLGFAFGGGGVGVGGLGGADADDLYDLDDDGDVDGGELAAVDENGEPRRWLRARIQIADDTLRLATNSRERLDAFLDLLREIGVEPDVVSQRYFQPALDLPLRRGRPMPYTIMDEEEVEDWAVDWLNLPMPGMSGRNLLQAAEDPDTRPIVETALRELEHDVQGRLRAGLPVPDVDALRSTLEMDVYRHLGRAGMTLGIAEMLAQAVEAGRPGHAQTPS